MMSLEAFDVDIVQPRSVLVYKLGADFWRLFEDSLVEQSSLTATVSINKLPQGLQFLFDIQGEVALVCDRSLKIFNHPIQVVKEIEFKWGPENKELDADVYMVERQATTINVAQHLYDFVCLAIPMKKIHPQHRVINEEL